MLHHRFTVLVLLFAANVCLGMGLRAPALLVEPKFGEFTTAFKIFAPSYGASKELSVLAGLSALWNNGDRALASALFLFSVVLPIVKLGTLWDRWWRELKSLDAPASSAALDRLARFSLLDVLVLSVLAVTLKTFPGGSLVHLQAGLYLFAASGVLIAILPEVLHRKKTLEELPEPSR